MSTGDPVLDESKPFVAVRDRTSNAAYQQGDSLFDRKKHFMKKASFTIIVKTPPPPVIKTRDISERRVGTTAKSIVGKLADKLIGKAAEVPPANPASPKGTGVRAPQRNAPKSNQKPVGVTQTLKKAASENAAAAAAESLAA